MKKITAILYSSIKQLEKNVIRFSDFLLRLRIVHVI